MNRIKSSFQECIICEDDFGMHKTMEPCRVCRKKYLSDGVMLIEVIIQEVDEKEYSAATGNFAIVGDSMFREMFPDIIIPDAKTVIVPIGIVEPIVKAQEKVEGSIA